MTQLQLIMNLLEWSGGFLFWTSATFPFIVSFIWPWWKSWWGRNIVSLEVVITAALLPSVLYREFGVNPDTYIFGWLTVAALFAGGVIVAWRIVLIFRSQLEEYRRDEFRSRLEEYRKDRDV